MHNVGQIQYWIFWILYFKFKISINKAFKIWIKISNGKISIVYRRPNRLLSSINLGEVKDDYERTRIL